MPDAVSLPPVTLHWQGSGRPSAEVLQPLTDMYGDKVPNGLLVIGEKGWIYTSHWNTGGMIRLKDEARLATCSSHEATKDIPQTLPRTGNHGQGMLEACRGKGRNIL